MLIKTIEEKIWENAKLFPDKIAVKSGKSLVTYRNLVRYIIAASNFFKSLPDYETGKTIILAASKQIEFVYAYFGAHMAGLRVAPVDVEINATRLEYICDAIKPYALVGFVGLVSKIQQVSLSEFCSINLPELIETVFPNQENIADILFTTGTTGLPKGVPLTYANELAAANQINKFIQNSPSDIELLALPVSHSFGLGRLRCCLVNGQTIILLGSFVNVKKLFRLIEEEHVTGFTMVPASWKFLQKMTGDSLSKFSNQLRYIELGSSFFSEDDKRYLASLFPDTRVTMHYGLTEASRSAFMEFHDDDAFLSSVGKASPDVDIGIFDSFGACLQPGEEGEICVKGAHVMKGYLGQDNTNTFFGDYFRTGDYGMMTPGGYVYLKSRIKELINVGGKKVAPVEVDGVILAVPGVVDCACVGVSDPDGVLGEVVKACIVKDPLSNITFEEIRTVIASKLEDYKVPIVWQWIDAVPKTHNGKIKRDMLK